MSVDGYDGEHYQVEDTDSDKLREILEAQLEDLADPYRLMPKSLLESQIAEVNDELLRRQVLVLTDRYITSLGANAVLYDAEDREVLARTLFTEAKSPAGVDRPITNYMEGVLN